jgi:LCP family protein required for cell wall assembly
MLLVRFDPNQKKLSVLSIPRDTRAWVDGLGMTKINAANSRGGPALSAKSVSELLGGVPIDRYIRINVQGVEKLLDALGGLTVYVPRDMKYQDDSQHLYINLKQGRQHLNGAQALSFLRFRHDEYGDIGRVQRQQMAMRSLKEQALNPATLLKLPQILSVIRENLDTNLSMEEIVALAGFATQVDRQNVQMLVIPGDYGDIARYGTSYWLPYPDQIRTMMAKHFDQGVAALEEAREPSQLKVAVQDASGNPELARSVARQLESLGYRQAFVVKPWKETIATTRVIAQNGNPEEAQQLREALGQGDVRVDSSGALGSDITIQVGSDWRSATTAPSR